MITWTLICYSFFQIGENFNFSSCSIRWESDFEGEVICFVGVVSQSNSTGKLVCIVLLRSTQIWNTFFNSAISSFILELFAAKIFLDVLLWYPEQNKTSWSRFFLVQILTKFSSCHQTQSIIAMFACASSRKQLENRTHFIQKVPNIRYYKYLM